MKHTLYRMYSAAHAATRSAYAATLLLTLLLMMAGACSREDAQVIAPDGFPADGRLAIGQLTIATDYNPNTRLAPDTESWEADDRICLTATGTDGTPLRAYYIYKESATWEQIKNDGSTPPSTYPLYIDDIDRTQPIRIDSWGGTDDAALPIYTEQGTPTDGATYRRHNHLACPAATLHTASDATPGVTRGSISGTLTHQRVDVVVRVLTDAAHPLSADDAATLTRLNLTLPADNSTGTDGATVGSWMEGSTDADATADKKAYTTFRAYLNLSDVPGAKKVETDDTGSYVVVTDASPLATLHYATTVGDVTLPGSGTLALRYSVQPTDGQSTPVRPGTRLVVTVDFTTLQNPVLTATVEPWQTEDEGEVGTQPGTGGTQPLDPDLFNADHPTWIVTGGGTPEADATVLKNVRDALNRIYAPFNADGTMKPAYTGTARIDLQLPGVTSLPKYTIDRKSYGAFANYGQLRSISAPLPTTIKSNAFQYCKALTTLSLPAATTIESNTFSDCTALTTLNLPAATTIEISAFSDCTALTTLSLPAATNIGDRAFYGCTALTTLSLPAAKSIGEYAFSNCNALTRLELTAASNITLDAEAFDGSGFVTTACDLVLNSDKANDATPKVTTDGKWGYTGKELTWKSITHPAPATPVTTLKNKQ